MPFGVGKRRHEDVPVPDEGAGHGRGAPKRVGHTTPDFMLDPAWTQLATSVIHGHLAAGKLNRLPRRDRDYVYRVVANLDSPVTVDQATSWYNHAPSGTTAGLAGAAKVREAKRIRAGRRVFDMSPSETQRYVAILADVESFLKNACSHYPDAVLPWVPRIDAARGLRLGHDEVLRRFAEAQACEKWNFLAAEATLQGLTPSWSGSYQLMFEFATDAAIATPSGHPVRALAAQAEAERLMRDRNLSLSLMPARESLNLPQLYAAYVKALPDDLDPDDVVGLGAFLFVMTPTDAAQAAVTMRALELLRRRCGGCPYTALGDPLAWFGRITATRESEAMALLGT